MQALTSSLSVGGLGHYDCTKGTLTTAFGAHFDDEKYLLSALWDKNVSLYLILIFDDCFLA